MSSNLIFVGNLNSPLAVERFFMVKKTFARNIFFYDRDKIAFYDDNLNLIFEPKIKPFFHIFSLFFLILMIVKNRVGLIHFHGVSVQFLSLLCILSKLIILATPQGSDINQTFKGKNKFFTKIVLDKANIITIKSDAMKRRVEEISNNRKIVNLNWGINEEFYIENKIHRSKDIFIISPRSNKKNYNIKLIFLVIERLKLKYNNIKFIYVSLHKDQDYELDLSIADEIYYNLNAKEMKMLYLKSDFMVSIPSNDGFSTSIMESLTCGCLPVISNLKAYDEVDADYTNVIKVDSPYKDNLEVEMINLIEDIDNIRSFAESRKLKYSKIYSKNHQYEILDKIYKDF